MKIALILLVHFQSNVVYNIICMSNKFEVLTGRSQILKRPQMWIGSMDLTKQSMFIINDEKVEHKDVEYIPAFRKIIDEILDNSLDALIENNKANGSIKVKIDDDHILIEDDGCGIPVVKKQLSEVELKNLPKEEAKILADSYIPFIAWTRLFSGSNFQDSANKTTIGSHGIGSKATAIFSTKFIGKTDDGKKSCVVKATDNLEKSSCKVDKSSGKTGTSVEFWPDLPRFKLSKIEQVYSDLMYQRLLCLSIMFPKIKFSFNGKRISINDKKFLKMFSENIEYVTFDKGFIGVYPNEYDDFNFFSYVNGINMSRGGEHINYVSYQLVNPIREKLAKKYKTIKPADIKNKFTLVVFLRDFANAKFDSQTKETLTNSTGEVSSFFGNAVDFEKFAKTVLKNDAIINPIVDMFKLKEELKARQELKKVKKIRVKADKYIAPTDDKKYLALCEGASAMSGISSCLDNKEIGYYAMRGLPLNAYDSSMQKIVANQELKDIINILGLDISKSDVKKTIDFDKILITTDNDADGQHITAMLIGWFKRFAPNLFDEGKICKLITPLIIVEDKNEKILEYFFNVPDFKKWEAKNPNNKNKIKYLKGLGSWERQQLIDLIDKYGIDTFLLEYKLDKEGDQYIQDWLGPDPEKRKTYLRAYKFDINQA